MRKLLLSIIGLAAGITSYGQIAISGYMANPAGPDSTAEYVQLVATQAIDFSTTPYSVVFLNNGTATADGWIVGGAVSYGFNLTQGSVAAGEVFYVGGDNKVINGIGSTDISGQKWIRTIKTNAVAGDGFGSIGANGVLGNGGNADGVGIFSGLTGAITSSTIPVDAIFYGSSVGTAKPGTGGYVVPTNDRYSNAQGTFGNGTNTYLIKDAAVNEFIGLTGTYDPATSSWTTARTFNSIILTPTSVLSDIASTITITNNAAAVTVDLTGFNGNFGSLAPNTSSAAASFSISGSNVNDSIALTVNAPFEIRELNGNYGTSVLLIPSSGTVAPAVIEVRFSPAAVGTFNDSVTVTVDANAFAAGITLQGVATSAPSLSSDVTGFNGNFGTLAANTSSVASTFEISGSNLTGNAELTVNAPFEIRELNGTYAQSVSIAPTAGTVNAVIEVRFSPVVIGTFYDSVEVTTTGGNTLKIAVTGAAAPQQLELLSIAKLSAIEGTTNSVVAKLVLKNRDGNATTVNFGVANRTAILNSNFSFRNNGIMVFTPGSSDTLDLVIDIIDENIPGPRFRTSKIFIQSVDNNTSITAGRDTIELEIQENDFKAVSIAEIKQNDANGRALGTDSLFEITGVLYGNNTRTTGYAFTIIDATGGMATFAPATASAFGYTITEGDSIMTRGRLTQFNGLSQLDFLDTIVLLKSNAMLKQPRVINQLTEIDESDLVKVNRVKLITPVPTWDAGTSGRNYRVVNLATMNDTFEIRILPTSNLASTTAPTGEFAVIGLGSQFDASAPFTSGYQLIPRTTADIILPVAATDTLSAFSLVSPANNATVVIQGDPNTLLNIDWTTAVPATGIAAATYEFLLDLPTGDFSAPLAAIPSNNTTDTILSLPYSAILSVMNTAGIGVGSSITLKWTVRAKTVNNYARLASAPFNITLTRGIMNSISELNSKVAVYPNPASSILHVSVESDVQQAVITNLAGQTVQTVAIANAREFTLDLNQLTNGVYFIRVTAGDQQYTQKIVVSKK